MQFGENSEFQYAPAFGVIVGAFIAFLLSWIAFTSLLTWVAANFPKKGSLYRDNVSVEKLPFGFLRSEKREKIDEAIDQWVIKHREKNKPPGDGKTEH